jgi:hypothetical protein
MELILVSQDNTEEIFKFDSLNSLFEFINEYTVEKLIDSNNVELKYKINVVVTNDSNGS